MSILVPLIFADLIDTFVTAPFLYEWPQLHTLARTHAHTHAHTHTHIYIYVCVIWLATQFIFAFYSMIRSSFVWLYVSYRGLPSFASECRCGASCRGLTIYFLRVGPPTFLEIKFEMRSGLQVWYNEKKNKTFTLLLITFVHMCISIYQMSKNMMIPYFYLPNIHVWSIALFISKVLVFYITSEWRIYPAVNYYISTVNGLSPVGHQTSIWIYAGILPIWVQWTKFNDIFYQNKIRKYKKLIKKCHLQNDIHSSQSQYVKRSNTSLSSWHIFHLWVWSSLPSRPFLFLRTKTRMFVHHCRLRSRLPAS